MITFEEFVRAWGCASTAARLRLLARDGAEACHSWALTDACRRGCADLVGHLLTWEGSTARVGHWCFTSAVRHPEILAALIESGTPAPCNLIDHVMNPGCVRSKTTRRASLQILLDDPRFDPGSSTNSPLEAAIHIGDVGALVMLLRDGRYSARRGLRRAALGGRADCVRALLADPRTDPTIVEGALRAACAWGRVDCVRALLEDGRIDPGSDALLIAAQANPRRVKDAGARIVELLLDDGRVDPFARRSHALRAAIECENVETFRVFCAAGLLRGARERGHFTLDLSAPGYFKKSLKQREGVQARLGEQARWARIQQQALEGQGPR